MTKARGQQVRMPPRRDEIDWQDRTTVMVRNIPSVYMQRDLINELDARGWKGTYDFFYLPFDLNKKQNMGYCFMNFKDPSLAERAMSPWTVHNWQEVRVVVGSVFRSFQR